MRHNLKLHPISTNRLRETKTYDKSTYLIRGARLRESVTVPGRASTKKIVIGYATRNHFGSCDRIDVARHFPWKQQIVENSSYLFRRWVRPSVSVLWLWHHFRCCCSFYTYIIKRNGSKSGKFGAWLYCIALHINMWWVSCWKRIDGWCGQNMALSWWKIVPNSCCIWKWFSIITISACNVKRQPAAISDNRYVTDSSCPTIHRYKHSRHILLACILQ